MALSDEQIELYSRQIILREVGGIGQRALLAARCLVIGAGAAFDTAVTYLVGAGIGAVDLLPVGSGQPVLPYADAATRGLDDGVRLLGGTDVRTLDAYDAVLLLPWRSSLLDPSLPPGQPRRGTAALRIAAPGALELALVRRDAGCAACVAWSVAERLHEPVLPDAPALAGGGALAALACCRWILGQDDAGPRRQLRLPAGSGVLWQEGALDRHPACTRGCPPSAQSV